MIRRMILNGVDYFYIDDIIKQYGLSSTYASKANIMGRVRHLGGKDFVTREDYEYIEELAKHETSCYTVNQTIAVTGLTDYALSSHEDLFNEAFTIKEFDGVTYYPRDEVDAMADDLRGMAFPVSEFCSRICGKRVVYINELFRYAYDKKVELLGRRKPAPGMAKALFPDDVLFEIYGNPVVACSISMDDLLESCTKVSLANILDNMLSPFREDMMGTIALMRRFYSRKMNACKSARIYDVAFQYANPLVKAYQALDKEIFDYSEAELSADVLNKPWCNNKTVMQFLQYVKENAGNGFGDGLTFVYQAKYNKNSVLMDSDIYSYEEWAMLYDYLTDINMHVQKAYEDRVYCQYWLIMLVYMTSLIRVSDIISLRSLHFEGETFAQYGELLRHPLELHDAVSIVNTFRKNLEALPTIKTDQIKHYYPVIDVTPAVATAVCVLECHRIRTNDIRLFTVKAADGDRIDSKFDGIPVRFNSTKATKTLATMIHDKAEEKGLTNALYLVSAARSHKTREGFSETTPIYLQQSKLEGDPREISRYVCRRGVFGWLYKAMLEFVNGDIKSLEEATTQIEALRDRLDPEQAERIAEFLQNAENEQRSTLKQLASYSRDNIAGYLMRLGTNATATNIPETYCILGKQCSRSRQDPTMCLRCSKSLKTNYTLELIGGSMVNLLNRMNETPLSAVTERQKLTYQIQILLFVLIDAKEWYDQYDPKFLDAYIDMGAIQAALNRIPDAKFLQIEEKRND